jgi:general stress protein YciG
MEYINNDEAGSNNRSKRGFASMDEEKQREIASKGGKAAHEKGTAHEFTSEEGKTAGRKGGRARTSNTYGIDNLDPGNNMLDDIAQDDL